MIFILNLIFLCYARDYINEYEQYIEEIINLGEKQLVRKIRELESVFKPYVDIFETRYHEHETTIESESQLINSEWKKKYEISLIDYVD